MVLAELRGHIRRAKVAAALDVALRTLKEPTRTTDVVSAIALILDTTKEEHQLIARDVGQLADTHPSARLTGETFVRYGKTMQKREWLPLAKLGKAGKIKLDPAELQRRREVVAAHAAEEAPDEWTVQPAPAESFLED